MSMSDESNNDAETPMERALRLKKAAMASKPQPPGGKFQRRQAAAMPSGASKPALRK
jgi:hypothetical protein